MNEGNDGMMRSVEKIRQRLQTAREIAADMVARGGAMPGIEAYDDIAFLLELLDSTERRLDCVPVEVLELIRLAKGVAKTRQQAILAEEALSSIQMPEGKDKPMKLTEVPFDQIKAGGTCESHTGTLGKVVSFDPSDDGRRRGHIVIEWANGRISHNSIFLDGVPWLDKVTYCLPH